MIGKSAWRLALTLAVLSTIGCDRVTKHAAATFLPGLPSRSYLADTVRLGYVENTGGFLSLGAELPSAVRTGLVHARLHRDSTQVGPIINTGPGAVCRGRSVELDRPGQSG